MAWVRDRSDVRGLWVIAACLGAVALFLWWPALSTPFWGDDYLFLHGALRSRLAGESWLRPFWPDNRFQFWRPLGHETYWRFVEQFLAADPWAAHLTNFVLWLLGCLSVGALGAALAKALSWDLPVASGALAAGVYAVLAVHFTPIHWTSSGDSLLVVLWSALALAAWTCAPVTRTSIRVLLCASIPFLQVLALFSKESAIVLPLLMLCLTAFSWERGKPGRPELAAWSACIALILVWLALRDGFVLPPGPGYVLTLDVNVLRNAASLAAWCLNIPREAVRMMILGPHVDGVLWALAAAVPMAGFICFAGGSLVNRVQVRQIAAAALFVLIAYGPYFFLARQSYEYYAQVAMIMPAVLLARGMSLSMNVRAALVLLTLSSFIAVEGSRVVGYPGLIGRARWAEEQLSSLVSEDSVAQLIQDTSTPLLVNVTNAHEFYGVGRAGLAWRLGLSETDIALVEGCTEEADVLVAFQAGQVSYVECAPEETDESLM